MASMNGSRRLMGLDVGDRRIGLAVSYDSIDLIMPVGYIDRISLSKDINQLFQWSDKRLISAFVVGIPYREIGSSNATQIKKIRRFISVLRSRTKLTVHTIDESYTTVGATGIMLDRGEEPSRRKGEVDAMAAAIILERFLTQEGSKSQQ
ncbi:MAG: Holliday junction resolvase RuvX [Dehalococcoidia bacterium]|nr:Holliday junction resolvase RuvX [Dehalococcoidia bacterium]